MNTCTTIEQRGVVRFLWAIDMAAKDIHKEISICLALKKQHLSGERFHDDDAVERAVCAWFGHQPQEFYTAGFQGIVKRWDKCLNLYGDYIEK